MARLFKCVCSGIGVLALCLVVAGCGDAGAQSGSQPAGGTVDSDGAPPRVLGAISDFTLVDQTGAAFGLRALRDKVWIATFIFTRCASTCPAQTAGMAKLQETLKDHASWEDVRLVSITVDPQYDTPTVLEGYAKNYEADPSHWSFLTGTRGDIWDLSKKEFMLPVTTARDAASSSPILHSPKFILVDRQARIRGYYDGAKADEQKRLLRDLNAILEEPSDESRRSSPNV